IAFRHRDQADVRALLVHWLALPFFEESKPYEVCEEVRGHLDAPEARTHLAAQLKNRAVIAGERIAGTYGGCLWDWKGAPVYEKGAPVAERDKGLAELAAWFAKQR